MNYRAVIAVSISKNYTSHVFFCRKSPAAHTPTIPESGADQHSLQWYSCNEPDCQNMVRSCKACAGVRVNNSGYMCHACWSHKGKLCTLCKEAPARAELKYRRSCAKCFAQYYPQDVDRLIRAESDSYLESISEQQKWNGSEPSLQLLVLPLYTHGSSSSKSETPDDQTNRLAEPNTSVWGTAGSCGAACGNDFSWGELFQPPCLFNRLPEYSSEPSFISPSHCRLCLKPVATANMEEHLKTCAKCSVEEYRRIVLRKTLGEWPQRIPAQVLRNRLAAFKEELCDANFRQLPCASCCRLKRASKLFDVSFPSPTADLPPSWLPWGQAQWLEYRQIWYDAVSKVLILKTTFSHSF